MVIASGEPREARAAVDALDIVEYRRRMVRLLVTGALVAALFQAPPARADPPPDVPPPAAPAASATAPAAAPTNSQAAAQLYYDAEARYAEGDVLGALERMREAYSRSGRPELLFNLGELRRELGQCVAARNDYAEYLARVPDGRKRDEATRKEAELRERCPDQAPRPAATTGASQPYWNPATIAGWATIGAGVVAAAGGTYFAVQASHDQQKLEEHMSAGAPFTQSDKQLEHDGERSAAWSLRRAGRTLRFRRATISRSSRST
jgi:tetratricopeptide (TPR) repeat protein